MLALLRYLIVSVLVVSVLRAVLNMISKEFGNLFRSSGFGSSNPSNPGPGPQTQARSVPTAESLKRDPVCGTFIAPSTAVTKSVGGQTYYYCSPACRDKHSL